MDERFKWLWEQLEKLATDHANNRDVIELGIKLAGVESDWRSSQPLRANG